MCRRELLLIGLFSLLAAARLLAFTAAFPFFNNVDEHYHFDLVCRYARADVPRGLDPCSEEASALIALYGTPEYVRTPREFPSGRMPPPVWSRPAAERAEAFAQRKERWMRDVNHEAVQPPFYYAMAGLWYDAGKLLGFEGGKLLYWTRLLNVPLYVLLVWLAYGLAKELVPASKFVYLGVPLVLAFLPQDIFYGLNNDVLSAPLATLSLYLLVRLYRSGEEKRGQSPTKLCLVPAGTARRVLRTNGDCPLFPSWGLALGAGLAVAAAMLTKFTNAPLLVIAAAVALLKAGLPWWRERSRTQLLPMALLLLVSLVPVGCWMARNYVVLGDPTGFSLRSRFMGWTPNPLGQYLHHPIFTPGGLLFFCHSLATTLWRGELLWHRSMLTIAPVDTLYFVSSMLLPLCFVMASFPGGEGAAARRQTAMLCLASVVLSVGLLVLFSISYDFGTGPFNYPSRAFPYFTQGRLILAALVPFLIVYLSGLESFLEWLRLGFLRLPLLIILADVMVISEIVYSLDVFVSQYNWFHLP